MTDIVAALGTTLAQGLFSSLDYPFRHRLDSDRMTSSDGETNLDFEIDPSPSHEEVVSGDDLLLASIEAFVAVIPYAPGGRVSELGEVERRLYELFSPYLADTRVGTGDARAETGGARPVLQMSGSEIQRGQRGGSVTQAILEAVEKSDDFGERFAEFARSGPYFRIDWVELELSEEPKASLGNPIRLQGLKVAVRAKGKACVRVLGKEFCTPSITTRWLRAEAAELRVLLESRGLQVYGLPSASNVDITITLKIFKWTYTVRIGITTHVNRALAKQRPLLFDASVLRLPVPALGRTYAPTRVATPQGADATTVEIDGRWA